MKIAKFCLFILCVSVTFAAAETKLLEASPENLLTVLLDRMNAGDRYPTQIRSEVAPGQVHVEYANQSDDKWSQVRWIVRFPLEGLPKEVQRAELSLLLFTKRSAQNAPLFLELIDGAQEDNILPLDRVSPNIGDPIEVDVPSQLPANLLIDVTQFVNEALKARLPYVAFRLSSTSESDYPENDNEAQVFYFGSHYNPYHWERADAPKLELTW